MSRPAAHHAAAPDRRVRVAVDAGAFVSPAPGVRRYVTELVTALRSSASDRIELVGVGRRPVVVGGLGMPIIGEGVSLPTNLGRSLTGLPAAIARAEADVFHAPAYTAPLVGSTPIVLSIHDVSYERHPEWYPYRRDALRRWFYRASARRAARILTGSDFSRREIEAAYGVGSGVVEVVPYGVSPTFAPAGSPAEQSADRQRVDSVVGRPGAPYLLHVGDLHTRRDLPLAVRVVAALRSRGGELTELGLVLVGTDRGAFGEVQAAARRAGIAGAVVRLEGLDQTGLVAVYRAASALIYPSRYEGFGFPLVEAMACGLPVVAACAGATPEVAGEAAMLVEAGSERAFVEALASLLAGPPHRRSELVTRGRQRAARFTWTRAADRTAEVYLSCLNQTRR